MLAPSFFSLGASTTIAWDSIYMSLSYFEQFLGKEVLSVLSLCFSLPLFFAMSFCILLRTQLGLRAMEIVTKVCTAYMLAVCIAMPIIVGTGCEVPATGLCALVVGCGISTGLMQSMVASMSAIFSQLSLESGASGAALKGTGGVILVPMAIQMALIPSAMAGRPTINLSIMVIFPLACCILLTSFGALRQLSRSTVWSVASTDLTAQAACMGACSNTVQNTIGKVRPDFTRQRALLIRWCSLGEIITLGVTGFLLSLTPHITPCSERNLAFWHRYLATILVSAHTVANFLGRLAVGGKITRPGQPSVPLLCAVVLARLAFVPLVVAYARSGSRCLVFAGDSLNLFITSTYFAMSFSGGAATMLLSKKAQALCNHSHAVPCEITSQLIWLSIQLGGLVGVAFSYIKVT